MIAHYCYTEDQIKENLNKLKFIIEEKWTLIKFEKSHIENLEVDLMGQNSIFFKIIENISGIYFLDRFHIFILEILYLFQGKEKLFL